MKTLDERIPVGGVVLWQTVTKGGKRFNLQVRIRPHELERLVAERVDGVECNAEFDEGPISLNITRQS